MRRYGPVRAAVLVWLAAAYFGIWLALFAAIVDLLPRRVDNLAGADREWALGFVLATGALVALVVNPVAGALSDRTSSKFGRRLVWTAAGAVVVAVALPLSVAAPNVAAMVIGWGLTQAGANCAIAAMAAWIADWVPTKLLGRAAAGVAAAQACGIAGGVALAESLPGSLVRTAAVIGAAAAVMTLPFLLLATDSDSPKQSVVSPEQAPPHRSYRDFVWALTSHGLFSTAYALSTVFLLYYLGTALGLADPQGGLVTLAAIATVALCGGAGVAGWLSDHLGRRKFVVMSAAGTLAAGALLLSFTPSWPVVVAAAVILALGYGAYLGVGQALVVQLLPTAADSGRDLGVVNITHAAPQLVAPVAAAAAVTGFLGYSGLYVVAATIACAAGLAIMPIRAVN